MEYDDYLVHYGVKGMKWGVRRKSRDSKPKDPERSAKRKKVAKKVATGVAVAGVAAAGAYAAYKFGPDVKNTLVSGLDNAARTKQGRAMMKSKDIGDSMKFALAMDAKVSTQNYNRLRSDAKSTVIRENNRVRNKPKKGLQKIGDGVTAYAKGKTPDQVKRDRFNKNVTKEQSELYRDSVFGRSKSNTSKNRVTDNKKQKRQETVKTARQTISSGTTAVQNVRKDVKSGTTMKNAVKRESVRVGLDYVNNIAEKKLKANL